MASGQALAGPTRAEAPETWDGLVDRALQLIPEVGEDRARELLEQELRGALQVGRERAEFLPVVTVEGAVRQARCTWPPRWEGRSCGE